MDGESGAAEERDSTKGRVARRAAMGRSRKARMGAPLDVEIVRRNGEGSKDGEKRRGKITQTRRVRRDSGRKEKRDGNTEFTEGRTQRSEKKRRKSRSLRFGPHTARAFGRDDSSRRRG
jgi:hypothetical protein